MGQYIVSARKYRPDSFETLIGQDNTAKTLKNSLLRGQLAHAYLFCGPRGVGKTSAARIFAKMINCEHPTAEMEPCGECESCVSFQEGRSYCIHELDAASNNGVDDIKALMEQVQVPPQVGKYSVYIIDEVHMLTSAAFNAFLKTLEEPPSHAIFILATTEKHKILPTILSRCQTYDFNRISIPDIVRNLKDIASKEGITIDDESLHVIAQKADGAMRDALTIFDQTVAFCGSDVKYEDVIRNLNVLDYEHCFALVDSFLGGDHRSALLKFDEVLSKGFNALHFVGSLSSHLRNLIVSKSGGLDALLELPDSLKKKYAEQASRCSLQFLYDSLATTVACEGGYRTSINPRLHIEFALMRLSFLQSSEVSLVPPAARQTAAKTPVQTARQKTATVTTSLPKAETTVKQPATAEPKKEVEETAPVRFSVQPAADEKPQETADAKPQETTDAQPQEAARPRRRVTKAASALSISSMEEEAKPEVNVDDPGYQGGKPDKDELMAAWATLPAAYASKPRLSVALSKANTFVSEDENHMILTFEVQNVSQKAWIEENLLRELEGRLVEKLKTNKIKLIVELTKDEPQEAVPYTKQEKAKAMMADNPEVQNIVKDLGLDV